MALDVRVPKPMMVFAVPWDITVLIVPDFVLMGILLKGNKYSINYRSLRIRRRDVKKGPKFDS